MDQEATQEAGVLEVRRVTPDHAHIPDLWAPEDIQDLRALVLLVLAVLTVLLVLAVLTVLRDQRDVEEILDRAVTLVLNLMLVQKVRPVPEDLLATLDQKVLDTQVLVVFVDTQVP
jgi:hypothetical protein